MSHPLYNLFENQRRQAQVDPRRVSSLLGLGSSLGSSAGPSQASDSKTISSLVPKYQSMQRVAFNEALQRSVDTHVSRATEDARLQAMRQPSDQDFRRQEFAHSVGGGVSSYHSLSRGLDTPSGGPLNHLASYSRPAADKPSVYYPASTPAGCSVLNVPSEAQRDFCSIPGLEGFDRPDVAQSAASSECTQPKYTSESAANILLHFGLEKEDLEHLIAYSEDQITPANLPFILRQIRIQKAKKAPDADRSKQFPQPAPTGGTGGLATWSSSGVSRMDHGDTASPLLQSSKIIDYGHTRKYTGIAGEDAESAGSDTLLIHNLDRGTRTQELAQQAGRSTSQDQASPGSSFSSMLTSAPPKSNIAVKGERIQPLQTQQSMFTSFAQPVKDTDLRDVPSQAPKARPFKQVETHPESQPPSTLFRGVHPNRPGLVVLCSNTTSEQPKGQGSGGAKPAKNLETMDQPRRQQQQQQKKQNLRKSQPQKPDNQKPPAPQKQQAPKSHAKQKPIKQPTQLEPVPWPPAFNPAQSLIPLPTAFNIPSILKVDRQPLYLLGQSSGDVHLPRAHPAQVVVSKGLPTAAMMQDYAASTPRVFPHSCSLCNKECALMKDWIAHQNTALHLESCKILRKQYPDWDGELRTICGGAGQKSTSTSQSQHKKSQRRSRSSSRSRSPRRRRSSDNQRDRRKSRSRSPYAPRYSRRSRSYSTSSSSNHSRSRSRSYERRHSRHRSQEGHSSSRKRSREKRSLSQSRRNKRSSPRRSQDGHSLRRSREKRSSSQSRHGKPSPSTRSRERRPSPRQSLEASAASSKSHPKSTSAERLAKKLLQSTAVQSLSKQSDVEAVVKTLAPALLAELAKIKSSPSQGGAASSQSSTAAKISSASSSATANKKKAAKVTPSQQKDPSAKNKFGKTSAPTIVTLGGIVNGLSHGDMIAAAEQYGKTKSVVVFRSRLQAVVCYEKKEDADKLRNVKEFKLKGFPITVVDDKEAVAQKDSQKKPDASSSVSTTPASKSKSAPSSKNAGPAAKVLVSKAKNISSKQVIKTEKGAVKKGPVKAHLKKPSSVKSSQGSKVISKAPKGETVTDTVNPSGGTIKEEPPSKCSTAEEKHNLEGSSELNASSSDVSSTQTSKPVSVPSAKSAVPAAKAQLGSKAKNVPCKQAVQTEKGAATKGPANAQLKTTSVLTSAQGSEVTSKAPITVVTDKGNPSARVVQQEEELSKRGNAKEQHNLDVSSKLNASGAEITQPEVGDAGPAKVTEPPGLHTTGPKITPIEAADVGPASVTTPPRDHTSSAETTTPETADVGPPDLTEPPRDHTTIPSTTQPEAVDIGPARLTVPPGDHTIWAKAAPPEAADVGPVQVTVPPGDHNTRTETKPPEVVDIGPASLTETLRDHTTRAETAPPAADDVGPANVTEPPQQAIAQTEDVSDPRPPEPDHLEPMEVDARTAAEEQLDKSAENQQSTRPQVEPAAPPASTKVESLVEQQDEADLDTKFTHAGDNTQEQKQQATAAKMPPQAATVQDAMSSHCSEAAEKHTIGEMVEQHLHQSRIMCLKNKTCFTPRFLSLNKKQLLITHLPKYHDGCYREEDVAQLLKPFRFKYFDESIYVIPQKCMAFAQLADAEDVLAALKASKNKDFTLKGFKEKLHLHVLGENVPMAPVSFYRSLMRLMDSPVVDYGTRTIFIKNISQSETASLREVLRKIDFVKNFLPLLNKLFVEFESDCDADRFGVWYSLLDRCPAYQIHRLGLPQSECTCLPPSLPEKAMPDSSVAVAGATVPTVEFGIPQGSSSPFWLTMPKRPYLFPIISSWFTIPEFLTIREEADIDQARRRGMTAPTIMLTGLPQGYYKHEDVARLVWPYFSQKDHQSLYYNVIVLPLQRRAFLHFHEWSGCCRFLHSHLKSAVSVGGYKLFVHFVLQPMCPQNSEENLYKSLMQLSNSRVGQVEKLAERLLCVKISEISEDVVKLVLHFVSSHATVVNFLPLANRICIEMADSTGVACVVEKSKHFSPNPGKKRVTWIAVEGFESVSSLKKCVTDRSVITLNLEKDRKDISIQGAVRSTVLASPSVALEKNTEAAQQRQSTSKHHGGKTVTRDDKEKHGATPAAALLPKRNEAKKPSKNSRKRKKNPHGGRYKEDFTEDNIPPYAFIFEDQPFNMDDFVTVDEVGGEGTTESPPGLASSTKTLSSKADSKQTNTSASRHSKSSACSSSASSRSTRSSTKQSPSFHSVSEKSKGSIETKAKESEAESQIRLQPSSSSASEEEKMTTLATKESFQVLDSVGYEEKPLSAGSSHKGQHHITPLENDKKQLPEKDETTPQVHAPEDEANKDQVQALAPDAESPLRDKGDEQKTNVEDDKQETVEPCQTKDNHDTHGLETSAGPLCQENTTASEEEEAYQVIDSVDEQPTSTENECERKEKRDQEVSSSSTASNREEHGSPKKRATTGPPEAEQKHQVVDSVQVKHSSSTLTPGRRRSTRGKTQGPSVKDEEPTFHILDSVDAETVQEEPSMTTRSSRGKRGRPSKKDASSEKIAEEEMTPTMKRTRTSQETTREETPSKKTEAVLKDEVKTLPAQRKGRRGRPKKAVQTPKSEDACLEKRAQDTDGEEEATFQVLDSVEDETLHDHNSPKEEGALDSKHKEGTIEIIDFVNEGPAKEEHLDLDGKKEGNDEAVETSQCAKRTRQGRQARHVLSSFSPEDTSSVERKKVGQGDEAEPEQASLSNWRGRAKKRSGLASVEKHHDACLEMKEEDTGDEEEMTFEVLDSVEDETLHDHISPKKEDMTDSQQEEESNEMIVLNKGEAKEDPLDSADKQEGTDDAVETSQCARRTRKGRRRRQLLSSSFSEGNTSLVTLDKVGQDDEVETRAASPSNCRGRAKKRSRLTSSEQHRDACIDEAQDAGDEKEGTFQVLDSVEDETLQDHLSPKEEDMTDSQQEEEPNEIIVCLNEGQVKEEPCDSADQEGKDDAVEPSQYARRTRQGRQRRHLLCSSFSEGNTSLVTLDKVGQDDEVETREASPSNSRGRAKKRSRLTSSEQHRDAFIDEAQDAGDEKEGTFQVLDSVEDETLHDHLSPKEEVMTDSQHKDEGTNEITDSLNECPAEQQPPKGGDEAVKTSQYSKRTRQGRQKGHLLSSSFSEGNTHLVTQDKVGEVEEVEPEEASSPDRTGTAKKRTRLTSDEHHHDACMETKEQDPDEDEAAFHVLDSVEEEPPNDDNSPKEEEDMTDGQLEEEGTYQVVDCLDEEDVCGGVKEEEPSEDISPVGTCEKVKLEADLKEDDQLATGGKDLKTETPTTSEKTQILPNKDDTSVWKLDQVSDDDEDFSDDMAEEMSRRVKEEKLSPEKTVRAEEKKPNGGSEDEEELLTLDDISDGGLHALVTLDELVMEEEEKVEEKAPTDCPPDQSEDCFNPQILLTVDEAGGDDDEKNDNNTEDNTALVTLDQVGQVEEAELQEVAQRETERQSPDGKGSRGTDVLVKDAPPPCLPRDHQEEEEEEEEEDTGPAEGGTPSAGQTGVGSKRQAELTAAGAKRARSQSPYVSTKFELPAFKPNNPLGTQFVVPKHGYFCELCSIFYLKESTAKDVHCSSKKHYNNLKKYYQRTQKSRVSTQGSVSD
uniref:uncharacterized protein LOC131125163 n=1 Tax=Doryrhamphus excisus TaxID=161450 RepID=UPI0025AE4430|nr:uncharacterized protein LOC131125163 [Doryrhamphus excisus]XP_057922400.1 uncharacterized protein LOC131125163 [Doryrhamphus excisus]